MKIPVVILFLITAISCSKKTATSQFAGTWTGTYNSSLVEANPTISDTGTLKIVVDVNSSATGTIHSLQGGATTIMHGTVNPSSGLISMSTDNPGGNPMVFFNLSGTLSANSGTGTLGYPWATISGWWVTKN